MVIINHYKKHKSVATSRQYDVSTEKIHHWILLYDDKKVLLK
jgi:hypothetical protein